MNSDKSGNPAQRAHRAILAFAFVAFGAAMAGFAPTAQAQGKAFSGGTEICNFSAFSYDAVANTLNIICTTSTTPPPPPPPTSCPEGSNIGTFSFWSGGVTATANGPAVEVQIHRSVSTQCAVTLNWVATPTGLTNALVRADSTTGAIMTSGSVTFNDGDYAPRKLFVTPGSTNGTMSLSLSGPAGVITPYATHVTTVTGATTTPPPTQPPPAGCTTTATYIDSFDRVTAKIFRIAAGQSAAMSFRTYAAAVSPSNPIKLSTIETTQTPMDADQEIRITACPGDFSGSCGGYVKFNGGSINVAVNDYVGSCKLDVDKTYYLNVRHVKPKSTTPSCTLALGCDVDLGIQNYRP